MLYMFFGSDFSLYYNYNFFSYLEKYNVFIKYSPQSKLSPFFNYVDVIGHQEKYLRVATASITFAQGTSLKQFTDSFSNETFYCEGNNVFLLELTSYLRLRSYYCVLIKFDYNTETSQHVYNVLKREIDKYCQHNRVLQSSIRLQLMNLPLLNKLGLNDNSLEKYIQLKNEVLSNCTEEGLNEQVGKFINLHYFKNEVFAYLGAEIVKKIEGGRYSKMADNAFNSLNPGDSLQTLQVSALTAIAHTQR